MLVCGLYVEILACTQISHNIEYSTIISPVVKTGSVVEGGARAAVVFLRDNDKTLPMSALIKINLPVVQSLGEAD